MALVRPDIMCGVCPTKANGFNYGAYTCNACKMFFRRSHTNPAEIHECVTDGNCVQLRDCRYCRFQQCLNIGMVIPKQLKPEITEIIQNLLYLDAHRNNTFSVYVSLDNLSLEDAIFSDSMKLTEKTPSYVPDYYDWSSMDHLAAIEFMKKFEFFKFLSKAEKRSFIKTSYIHIIVLCLAMRSVGLKSQEFVYPNGVDVFPKEIQVMFQKCPSVLADVRCPLVARIHELKVTREEFVLLTAIITCNPGNEAYTVFNQEIISKYQQAYTSALVQYCLHTYQQFGPTRVNDLLSLCFLLGKAFEGFGSVWTAYMVAQNDGKVKKLHTDFLKYFLD
ncbi:hypothetical protein GCK72_008219 [Caenorhabditis remanei]|uniref:Uncharacterized protein n=1 Tax=Caenorhabditis remanei TaxID=31234 RepID=A0A6A5GZL7_CAERE|nr:hypothetical protein GCK72_008219 [Caenorhabditis remanei]KAF1759974.1 hypothetical protein GCK72_008219 [Caenorhabditis remanei]